jgi:WS/DGAT/MGAT family acyltransferase
VDAAFLYLERKEIPLHTACVSLFDGPIPFDEFVERIESRLHLIPRYRQIVVAPPFDAGYPTWEHDRHFDIRRHIFRVHLDAPGGQAQLEALAGRIFSQLMDRSKPLWDIHLVDGLKSGHGALIIRIHHALADGIAGVAVVNNVILDPTPEVSAPIRKPRARVRRGPVPKPSLAGAIASGIRSSLDHLIAAEAGFLEIAQALLSDRSTLEGVARLLPELLGAVERLPFNKPCSGDRKFCWADFDLSAIQAIRATVGGSVNDIVLTVLTRAIARYVELHGQTVANRLIRVVCPVNLRRDNGESLGNQISFLPVVLPLDVDDPIRLLQAVAARTAIMKKARAADLVALAASCLGIAPPPLQAMMWRGISQVMLPLPLFNIICTNLPGSQESLYCVGRRMLSFYPQVPTGYELGINCAVQSYCGKLSWGLIADAQVAPDVTRLRDFLYVSFEELCLAAGVKKPGRRATAVRKTRPRPAKAARPPEPELPEREPDAVSEPPAAARKARPVRAKPAEAPATAPAGPSRRRQEKHAAAPPAMSAEAGG